MKGVGDDFYTWQLYSVPFQSPNFVCPLIQWASLYEEVSAMNQSHNTIGYRNVEPGRHEKSI